MDATDTTATPWPPHESILLPADDPQVVCLPRLNVLFVGAEALRNDTDRSVEQLNDSELIPLRNVFLLGWPVRYRFLHGGMHALVARRGIMLDWQRFTEPTAEEPPILRCHYEVAGYAVRHEKYRSHRMNERITSGSLWYVEADNTPLPTDRLTVSRTIGWPVGPNIDYRVRFVGNDLHGITRPCSELLLEKRQNDDTFALVGRFNDRGYQTIERSAQ